MKPGMRGIDVNPFKMVSHDDSNTLHHAFCVSLFPFYFFYSLKRTSPVDVIEASDETFMSVRFNPVERTIVAGTTSDRAIVLMDIRSGEVVQRVKMEVCECSPSLFPSPHPHSFGFPFQHTNECNAMQI
jgi:hypothetical protein